MRGEVATEVLALALIPLDGVVNPPGPCDPGYTDGTSNRRRSLRWMISAAAHKRGIAPSFLILNPFPVTLLLRLPVKCFQQHDSGASRGNTESACDAGDGHAVGRVPLPRPLIISIDRVITIRASGGPSEMTHSATVDGRQRFRLRR